MKVKMNELSFKNYLELNEDYELFLSLEENIIYDVPKFAAGAAGNIVGQGLRGAGNIIGGGFKAAGGLGSAALGSLQYLGGNKDAKKKAKEKIHSGLGDVTGGLGKALRGSAQILATPITAPIRAAQAVDDKTISGVLAPNDPKRNYWQDLFGLDSGTPELDKKPEESPIKPTRLKKTVIAKKSFADASQAASAPQEWIDLVDRLRSAKSSKEGTAIVARMKMRYPHLYADAKKRALSLSRRRPSTNPSGLLRSGPTRTKPVL